MMYRRLIFVCGVFLWGMGMVWASEKGPEFDLKEMLYGHVLDGHVWHFADGKYGTLYLPVILYSRDRGWEIFSSAHFFDSHHRLVSYKGYYLSKGRIGSLDSGRSAMGFFLDEGCNFSIFRGFAFVYDVFVCSRSLSQGKCGASGLTECDRGDYFVCTRRYCEALHGE